MLILWGWYWECLTDCRTDWPEEMSVWFVVLTCNIYVYVLKVSKYYEGISDEWSNKHVYAFVIIFATGAAVQDYRFPLALISQYTIRVMSVHHGYEMRQSTLVFKHAQEPSTETRAKSKVELMNWYSGRLCECRVYLWSNGCKAVEGSMLPPTLTFTGLIFWKSFWKCGSESEGLEGWYVGTC